MSTQGIGQCKGCYSRLKGARFEGNFHGIPRQEVMIKGFPGKFWGSIVGRLLKCMDWRGGGRWGGELVYGWGEEGMVKSFGRLMWLRKPAVDFARTCNFQGGQIFS